MSLDEEITDAIQNLPLKQCDAVFKRLRDADWYEGLYRDQEALVKDLNESIERLKRNNAELTARVGDVQDLEALTARVRVSKQELDVREQVLQARTEERELAAARTHELLGLLFRNTTVRRNTMQAVVVPTASPYRDVATNQMRHDPSGAFVQREPIEETETEE